MANYLDTITGYGGRSYNTLVISEGDMPAESFIPSSEEDVKFTFAYGPENNNNVVIPKGKILAAAGVEYDQLTETYRPAVKICTQNDTPIGVAPYNVYETRFGAESENTISPITRNYIKLPLFVGYNGNQADVVAASIGFGAMSLDTSYNESTPKEAIASGIMGQYVVSDDNGNFVVKAEGDGMEKVVGQVLAVELDTPPAGFLQYCLELGNVDYADFIKKTREVIGLGQSGDHRRANQTFPGLASFAYGMGYPKKGTIAADYLTQLRGGIRFLTDAYFKSKTQKKIDAQSYSDANVEIIFGEGSGLSFNEDKTAIVYDKAAMTKYCPSLMIKLNKKVSEIAKDLALLDHLDGTGMVEADLPEYQTGLLESYIAEYGISLADDTTAKINPKLVKVDLYNNALMLYLDPTKMKATTAEGEDKTITFDDLAEFNLNITLPVISREVVGLPTMRDFKGCVGTVSILLQK